MSGGSNPCDFDGTYQVPFGVRCSDVAETDCPIDENTDSVEITLALTVSTSNHCPSVIDSVDLNAALAVYDLPARADHVGRTRRTTLWATARRTTARRRI